MAEMADEEQELDDFIEVTVLEVGSTVPYTVPSFPVFKTKLVEVKLLWEEHCEGSTPKLLVFHGFAKKCDTLDHSLPAIAHLPFNYDCCFTIFVSNIFMLK